MAQLVEKVESFLFTFDRDELYKIVAALYEDNEDDLAMQIEELMCDDDGCEICGDTH